MFDVTANKRRVRIFGCVFSLTSLAMAINLGYDYYMDIWGQGRLSTTVEKIIIDDRPEKYENHNKISITQFILSSKKTTVKLHELIANDISENDQQKILNLKKGDTVEVYIYKTVMDDDGYIQKYSNGIKTKNFIFKIPRTRAIPFFETIFSVVGIVVLLVISLIFGNLIFIDT